jgi:thiol-disulfide isomerase/thioredoxin
MQRHAASLGLCLFLALGSTAAAGEPPDPPDSSASDASEPKLIWLAHDGTEKWDVPLVSRLESEPQGVLTSTTWYKPLPDLEVRLFGGGTFPLREAGGSVLILDFWASWCVPCLEGLPKFQALYDKHREAGLEAVAINVGESPQLAIPYAEDMGLTMPIGIYQQAMTPTLYGKALPALVVVDRQGKIRGRWDGFERDYAEQIEALVDRLMAEQGETHREVASVLRGNGLLRIEWLRETAATIEDLVVMSGEAGAPAIFVSHGRLMALHNTDGTTERQWAGDRAAGRVRLDPFHAGDGYRLASFRPGGRRIVLLEAPGGERSSFPLDSYIFDIAWLPEAWRKDGRSLIAGTLDGLMILGEEGDLVAGSDEYGAVAALGYLPSSSPPRLLVLESEGRLSWVGDGLSPVNRIQTVPAPWLLSIDESSNTIGVASDEATALTTGSFFADRGEQVVIATRSGRLLVLSVADGEVVFEASWDGITGLAAGDLTGDGLDELVVAKVKELAVLTPGEAADH